MKKYTQNISRKMPTSVRRQMARQKKIDQVRQRNSLRQEGNYEWYVSTINSTSRFETDLEEERKLDSKTAEEDLEELLHEIAFLPPPQPTLSEHVPDITVQQEEEETEPSSCFATVPAKLSIRPIYIHPSLIIPVSPVGTPRPDWSLPTQPVSKGLPSTQTETTLTDPYAELIDDTEEWDIL